MTHFTHTGILAGTPMCAVSRRQAQEHGDQLQHPAYSKAGYEDRERRILNHENNPHKRCYFKSDCQCGCKVCDPSGRC